MITLTDLPTRLADLIDVHGGLPVAPLRPVTGECWTVNTWHNTAGYPYVREDGRDQPAHRVIYEAATGEDITDRDLDHVCRNVACANPNHEDPVTHAENQRRLSQAQTSCRRARHDWTNPNNVRTRPNGRRYCAECDRTRVRNRRAHQKETSN